MSTARARRPGPARWLKQRRARAASELLLRAPVPGNRVELLVEGDRAFDAMLAAIASARDHVLLEVYWIAADSTGRRFARTLAERARAGVDVRILVDGFGSLGAEGMLATELAGTTAAVAVYRPLRPWHPPRTWQRRDHRKILVVDGEVGFAGGMNLCDPHLPIAAGGKGWRDVHLRVEGPAVPALGAIVRRAWRRTTGEALDAPRYAPPQPPRGPHPVLVLANREWGERHVLERAHLQAFRRARSSILVSHGYFLPSRKVRRALVDARRRGVEVAVLQGGISDVPVVQHAARHMYGSLLEGGIEVREWPGRVLHAKAACVDGRWSAVGSYNLDPRSFRYNLEVVLFVAGESFGHSLEATLRADLAQGTKIELHAWRRRPWWRRLLGAFWYGLRGWL